MRKNEIIELLLQEKTLYGIFLKFVEIYNLEESKFEFIWFCRIEVTFYELIGDFLLQMKQE